MNKEVSKPKSQGTMPVGLPLRALPLYVFLHVPKAAGTSVRTMLRQMVGQFYWQLAPRGHMNSAVADEPEWKQAGFFGKYLMIGVGHNTVRHPIVHAARHTGRRLVFIGTLREPAARAASLYDYIRRHPEHPMYGVLSTRSLFDAVEYVDRFRYDTVNAQLWQLFGSQNPVEIDDILARENYILGRQDKLDAFMDAVCAVSGVPHTQSAVHSNAAEKDKAIVLERAREQPDYLDALSRLADLNVAEATFLQTRISSVLVTTATCPRRRALSGSVPKVAV